VLETIPRIHLLQAEAVPHISLLPAEAVLQIYLLPADPEQAPPTAEPVAIQFLQEAPAADQCLPDLTAEAADHHHIAVVDQYQEVAVVHTHQVPLQVPHHQEVHHREVLHLVAAEEDVRKR
jgi:hypothetical protein